MKIIPKLSFLSIFLILLIVHCALSICFAGEPLNVTVNPGKTLNPVDLRVYSHFLEHIYNSCNGGLWGELVWNRSFESGSDRSWCIDKGTVIQNSEKGNPRFFFGDETWTDYEFSCDAKKLKGQEGFLLIFRSSGDVFCWANLGAWRNAGNVIERTGLEQEANGNKREVRKGLPGTSENFAPIETGRTYHVRVRVEGKKMEVFIDEKRVLDVDGSECPTVGGVGLSTWDTSVEYSNILVKDLAGNVLFDGNVTPVQPKNPPTVRFWNLAGRWTSLSDGARNGKVYLRALKETQIEQENYNFHKGEKYDFSFWSRGCGVVTVQGTGAEKLTFSVDSAEWKKYSGTFTVADDTTQGALRLNLTPVENAGAESALDLDQVSIMPRSWKEDFGGFRPDLLQAVKNLQPTMIRWPGGCYASGYRWKDGIGPQDDRGSFPMEMWNDLDVNSLGTDEFIQLCKTTGAEPIFVVNIGTWTWLWGPGEAPTKEDWYNEICNWIEYCNGSVDTYWGAIRAKNGHPEPYNVKYWEIDNEIPPFIIPSSQYIATMKELIPRMKAVSPDITIVACGSWTGDRDQWDADIVNSTGADIGYISTHQYDDPNGYAVNPYINQRFFEKRAEIVAESGHHHVKVFDSEWNAQSTDWRTGLHAGGILNCFEKSGDILKIATPALFLRHVSANDWDNAFINFDHTGWFPAPNYVVMKLWREFYEPVRVELVSDSAPLNGENPLVNAVATRSEDGKTVVVKIVNNQMEDATLNLSLANVEKIVSVTASTVTPTLADGEPVNAKLRKRNTLENPQAIVPHELGGELKGDTFTTTLPSLSATILKFKVE